MRLLLLTVLAALGLGASATGSRAERQPSVHATVRVQEAGGTDVFAERAPPVRALLRVIERTGRTSPPLSDAGSVAPLCGESPATLAYGDNVAPQSVLDPPHLGGSARWKQPEGRGPPRMHTAA